MFALRHALRSAVMVQNHLSKQSKRKPGAIHVIGEAHDLPFDTGRKQCYLSISACTLATGSRGHSATTLSHHSAIRLTSVCTLQRVSSTTQGPGSCFGAQNTTAVNASEQNCMAFSLRIVHGSLVVDACCRRFPSLTSEPSEFIRYTSVRAHNFQSEAGLQ